MSPSPSPSPQAATRVTVRAYGSPIPLGFFSFGIGMLVLAGEEFHWIAPGQIHTAGLVIATFVFPLEFLAAVIAFLARDAAASTALGLFSASWLALGLTQTVSGPQRHNAAIGLWLIGFGVMMFALVAAALKPRPLLGIVLTLAGLHALLGAPVELGGPEALAVASGAVDFTIFVYAIYGGLAFLLEDARGQAVLPVPRNGAAHAAFHTDLDSQTAGIHHEAGIRNQL